MDPTSKAKKPPADDTPQEPPTPRLDAQGRPMVEEIDLNADEEAALDAAWESLRVKWAKEGKPK